MQYVTLIFVLLLASANVFAGQAEIVEVRVEDDGDGHYTFFVTVRHEDQGWKHYVDKWEVVAPDGRVLGTRMLAHPHVNEQPFTRSLGGVHILKDIKQVMIRAHDSVHGYGNDSRPIVLPK